MPDITLESVGITRDDVLERVSEIISGNMLNDRRFTSEIDKCIEGHINDAVNNIALQHVIPSLTEMIENYKLQQTSMWGEKVGEPRTFTQYLVDLANSWMTETVDYAGKPKGRDGYAWTGKGTRVAHMIHEHLYHNIDNAMKIAMADLNKTVAEGIAATVKIQLQEVLKRLKVEVKA